MYISNKPSTDIYRNAGDLRNHPAGSGIEQDKVHSATSQPDNESHIGATFEPGQQALPDLQGQLNTHASSSKQQNSQSDTESPAGSLQGRTAQLAAAFEALTEDEIRQGIRGQIVREEASMRAQQAIMTYQFHQNLTERDHITTVLGIDEYA